MIKELWPIKYRPVTLDGYIFQNESHRNIIEKYIKEQSIPNLILKGHRGTGKTTLAGILANACGVQDYDMMITNASSENSVNDIRYKVKSFVTAMADGPFRIVFLDEADELSPEALAALKAMMENKVITSNARFILACNHGRKLLPEIKSRCHELTFDNLDKDMMLEKAAEILKTENVKVSSVELLEEYVDLAHPDLRKLIVLLEQNSIDGVLQSPTSRDLSLEWKIDIMESLNKGNWERIRSIVCDNVANDEYVDIYRFMYDHLHEIDRFKDMKKWKNAIVTIGDYLYRHDKVADVEINFTSCIIKLTEI